MDEDTAKRLVKAARALLRLDVATFARALGVGTATVKRIEADHAVRADGLDEVLARLPKLGIRVLGSDSRRGALGGIVLTAAAPIGPDSDPVQAEEGPLPRGRPPRRAASKATAGPKTPTGPRTPRASKKPGAKPIG